MIAGVALAFAWIGACRDDVTAADTEDARTLDNALQQSVLQAHENTPPEPVEIDEPEDTPVQSSAVDSKKSDVKAAEPPPAPVIASNLPARSVAPRQPAPIAVTPTVTLSPAPRTATVPAGTELALESSRRICVNTSRAGDQFSARLASSGTAIPRGARATGQITSLVGPLGEETIEIAIRSIAIGGRTYPVNSRVTRIELDRRPGAYRCIPADGRITAQLTRPLRVTL